MWKELPTGRRGRLLWQGRWGLCKFFISIPVSFQCVFHYSIKWVGGFFACWEAFLVCHQGHYFFICMQSLLVCSLQPQRNSSLLAEGRHFVVAMDYLGQMGLGFFSNCWFSSPSSFLRLLLVEEIHIAFPLLFLFAMHLLSRVRHQKGNKRHLLRSWKIFSQPPFFCHIYLIISLFCFALK